MREDISFRITDTIRRPGNTTQYTIGDVITNVASCPFQFRYITPEDGLPVLLTDAFMISNNVPATAGSFYLLLYRTSFMSAADNAPFTPTLSQHLDLIGIVSLDTALKTANHTYYKQAANVRMILTPDPVRDKVYAFLIAANAYVPAANEQFITCLTGRYRL